MHLRILCLTLLIFFGHCQTSSPDNTQASPESGPVELKKLVQLDVPVVTQHRESLSGSASVEMIFKYWGENRYSQLDIARSPWVAQRDPGEGESARGKSEKNVFFYRL